MSISLTANILAGKLKETFGTMKYEAPDTSEQYMKDQKRLLREMIAYNETRGVEGDPYKFEKFSGDKAMGSDVGKYQVTEGTLKTYAPKLFNRNITKEEFLNSPELQDEFIDKLNDYKRELGFDEDTILATHRGGFGRVDNITDEEYDRRMKERVNKRKDYVQSAKKYKSELLEKERIAKEELNASPFERVRNKTEKDIDNRVELYGEILKREKMGKQGKLTTKVQEFGQGVGLASDVIDNVIGEIPVVKDAISKYAEGVNWLATSDLSLVKEIGDMIGDSKNLQDVVRKYDTDPVFRDTVDAFANTIKLSGQIYGTVKFTTKFVDKLKGVFGGGGTKADLSKISAKESTVSALKTKESVSTNLKNNLKMTDNMFKYPEEYGVMTPAQKLQVLSHLRDDTIQAIQGAGKTVPKSLLDLSIKGTESIDDLQKVLTSAVDSAFK